MKVWSWSALVFCMFVSSAAHAQLGSPMTIHNDDTCDIAQFPAATLLVPYFEVDVTAAREVDTLVNLVNTGQRPQIVSATVWSSWGLPVYTFDTFLGGYDVHSYALHDLLVTGNVPSSSVNTPRGPRSISANPNWAADAFASCHGLPAPVSRALLTQVQSLLTLTPSQSGESPRQPRILRYAIGYITFDVVSRCGDRMQPDAGYFSEILYDNVLTGDVVYSRSDPQRYASVPMVHIRAIPEGGLAGQRQPVSLPFTFYDLYTPEDSRKLDRRQPLPALFAGRYLQRHARTEFLIWREPQHARAESMPDESALMEWVETVRFDEHENPTTLGKECHITCVPISFALPSSARVSLDDSIVFPPVFTGTADAGGWMYLNLSNGGSADYSPARRNDPARAGLSQNWVQTLVFTDSQALSLPVTQLGNGCTPMLPETAIDRTGEPALGPAPDLNR